jgi:formate hydrogenlyase subunit 3/multisubunit Na+/H+ antiporter MnhD subunit
MIGHLSTSRAAELGAAVLLLLAGIIFYRRKPTDGSSYGDQGAVLLLAVAVIVGIHALGGLDYHPTQAEANAMRGRAQ